MSDAKLEVIPSELPHNIQPHEINFGSNKTAQIIEFDGKKMILKYHPKSTSWYYYRNSRELANKYPSKFAHNPMGTSVDEAKAEQRSYEDFCISFGPDPNNMSSKSVAQTLVVIGNHTDPGLDIDRQGLNNEEKDFVGVHIYQELIPEQLRDTLSIDVKNMTFENYERLRTLKFEDLNENEAFEKSIRRSILKYREPLRRYYARCVEAALCGLVPDLHVKFMKTAEGQGVGYRHFGYLFTSGVGISSDGEIKNFDFDSPHLNIFDQGQKLIIRNAIDEHKSMNEYALEYYDNGTRIEFSEWYVSIVNKMVGSGANKYLAAIKRVFLPVNEINIPYLESMRQLIGVERYGSYATG